MQKMIAKISNKNIKGLDAKRLSISFFVEAVVISNAKYQFAGLRVYGFARIKEGVVKVPPGNRISATTAVTRQ